MGKYFRTKDDKLDLKPKRQINPFSTFKSLSGISITCTNLCGLDISVKELADKQICRVLNLKAAVHVLIDTGCTESQFSHFLNTSKFKNLLSSYKFFGTYTKSKGIIVLVNNKRVKVDKI